MKIDKGQDISLTKHIGRINDNEFLSAYTSFHENDDYRNVSKRLVDLRLADSRPRSSKALRISAEISRKLFAETGKRIKVAIVAPQALSFGLARMYMSYHDGQLGETMVFREISEALDWLQVDQELLNDLLKDEP